MKILLLLLLAAPVYADRKTEEIILVSSAAADIASTQYALSRGGVYEVNPLGATFARRVAFKTAGTAAVILLARLAEREGHSKMASVLRYSAIAVNFGATGWNVSLTISVGGR